MAVDVETPWLETPVGTPADLAATVIIPTRNRADSLCDVVASLLKQTCLPRELLIIDQSADDTGRRRVAELFAAAPAAVRQAITLRHVLDPSLSGVPAARNYAVAHAGGDYWLFLDDDVVLEPDYIERILDVYRADPGVTGVSGVVTNYPAPSLAFRWWRRIFERGPFRDERQPVYWRAHVARDSAPVRVTKFGGHAMSFRAASLAGYRYEEHPGCPREEDVDFCLGLGPSTRLVMTPRARQEHRRVQQLRGETHRWILEEWRGARSLYRRHWQGRPAVALCFAWLTLGYALLAVWERLRPAYRLLRRRWAWALAVALAAALYAPVIAVLVGQWWSDPNYSHGFLIPVVSGWLVWQTRGHWRRLPLQPSNGALAVVLAAPLLLAAGTLGAELFVSRISLLILLVGVIAFAAGWRLVRAWAFPLGFLLFMIPLPAVIYYQITFPLQLLASRLASGCLDLLQIPALREGNVIQLPNYTMSVAEACSGIRSLISLGALAVAYGYFREARIWKRVLLAVLMVPIAIASNAFRIVGTGVLTYYFGPRYAEGFFHAFSGWLIFLVAFSLMLLAHRLLSMHLGRARLRSGASPLMEEESPC